MSLVGGSGIIDSLNHALICIIHAKLNGLQPQTVPIESADRDGSVTVLFLVKTRSESIA